MLSFILTAFGFIKNIVSKVPAKYWLYIALVLAYPACYFVGHHKGYVAGVTDTEEQYKKQQEKQAAENKKENEEDQKKSVQDNSELVNKVTQLEASKEDLTKKLNDYAKIKAAAPKSTCPQLSADDERMLREAVDKANN